MTNKVKSKKRVIGKKSSLLEKQLQQQLSVGIRQLRQDATGVLRLIKAGKSITVTQHGRAVAQLVPIANPSIQDYIDAGVITPPTRKYNSKVDKPLQLPAGIDLVAELLKERAESRN
jgi:prevent-host-death family protein